MNVVLKESLKYSLRSRYLIWREIRHVEWLYSLSADELHAYKESKFLEIFRRAYKYSSFYKEFYYQERIEEGDIKSLDDINRLPVVTKSMVKDYNSRFLTVPRWAVFKAETSGTTGTPLTAYHSYKSIRLEQAYIAVRRKKYGFNYGQRLVSLRGNLGSRSFRDFVSLSNTLFLSSYLINDSSLLRYFEAITEFEPRAIEGYPSSLYSLALGFSENGWVVKIPLCFTSSEKLLLHQRELIENVFGCEIFDRYGCSERSISLAENLDHYGYYEEPGYSHNQFFSDHILTTSLFKTSFPLIRYQVNDVVVLDEHGVVKEIEGRNEDVIVCNDGTKIGRIDHIFKGVRGVKYAQVVQRISGHVDINVVPDLVLDDCIVRHIEEKLRRKVSTDNLTADYNSIAFSGLIFTSRNKFSLVKSYL